MLAAIALARAAVGAHGFAVGAESRCRLDAPVRRRVVGIEELELIGIGRGRDVHPLVSKTQAVHATRQLRRSEMFHKLSTTEKHVSSFLVSSCLRGCIHTVLIPAACRIARLTTVFATCTL